MTATSCLQRSWIVAMTLMALNSVGSVYAAGPTFVPIRADDQPLATTFYSSGTSYAPSYYEDSDYSPYSSSYYDDDSYYYGGGGYPYGAGLGLGYAYGRYGGDWDHHHGDWDGGRRFEGGRGFDGGRFDGGRMGGGRGFDGGRMGGGHFGGGRMGGGGRGGRR